MGNAESNVTSGVKNQAGPSVQPLYKLVDVKGGGLLVDMMKRAAQTKQFAELDHAIKTKVEPFLYNKGKGRLIPVRILVLLRNKNRGRHKMLPPLKNMDDPSDYNINMALAQLDAEGDSGNDPGGYRDVCWDLAERGAVGETIVHLCILAASSLHNDLLKRLLRFYPKLVNDIYMDDEYYGEGLLHIAIVNEDPSMVKFLLDAGADVHERCYGAFMSPEDQKASRNDSLDHEWVNVTHLTNYEGYVYWGEYPLSFAACLNQEECYRLILARNANPDNQDTNGNTVLHMLVIYKNQPMFDVAYEMGSSLEVRNVRNLTPLTLAAKVARRDMFFHILNIEREIYWQIGSVTCAAYPLSKIDTIDIQTGNISKDSALNLVVFGDSNEHLELMEGVLVDLLNAKWNAFIKTRFYRQFFQFVLYFLISLVCFTLRPGPPRSTALQNSTATFNGSTTTPTAASSITMAPLVTGMARMEALDRLAAFVAINVTAAAANSNGGDGAAATWARTTSSAPPDDNDSTVDMSVDFVTARSSGELPRSGPPPGPLARAEEADDDDDEDEWWDETSGTCRLMQINSRSAAVRIVAEVLLMCGAVMYILAALREARFLGLHMFIENLMTAPSRVMFLFSCCCMLSMPWLRLACEEEKEDIVAVIIMLTTSPYFLFFCRGFKTVGPFVVMIYRMVMGDLLRFVSIYLVFVMGFSQAYYIIFLSFDNPLTPDGVDDTVSNPMPSPSESVMAMFLMSLTNFGDYYGAFERTEHEIEAKILFVVFMAIVAILLVNMLIAMMGNTYQKIAETRNEWQRQWARIVLVVERGVNPAERLRKLMWYSQPMSDGRRALVLRLNQTEEDKEEMKEILEMKGVHRRMVQKRKLKGKRVSTVPPSPKKIDLSLSR
ncbi:hypothetical protein ONE63_002181 [Megalurothrips usitatus]|uniref:Ion transport domain-containing protein n=1 Tax=Megalurothrips usitatus TaxID=439358 RepID=A0AAV7XAP3_9NEOP|nr:hypothetical protein ONE63_002181 [Megalurothrips usitatus]